MIWKRKITLEALNAMGEGNMVGLLDIRFEHIGDDTLEGDNASRLADKAAFRVAAWRGIRGTGRKYRFRCRLFMYRR
ncbi:esterase [Escherichia coli]|nr:esterase [Escherichia coli]